VRGRKFALTRQRIQRAIAQPGRNQNGDAGSAIEGEIKRSGGPIKRLGLIQKRRLDQYEDAQRDVVIAQP
jgi:hypothetical protein